VSPDNNIANFGYFSGRRQQNIFFFVEISGLRVRFEVYTAVTMKSCVFFFLVYVCIIRYYKIVKKLNDKLCSDL
jgi:hypothetical protein